jgi:TonB family protein
MEKGRNNTLFTPSGCLTEKGLSMFTNGQLTEEETTSVKSHLQTCELCSLAAEGYLIADPEAFSEDVSFLNSGFVRISLNEEKIQEHTLPDEKRIEGSVSPVNYHKAIKPVAEGLNAKATSPENHPSEHGAIPASFRNTKTAFPRYQYRLLAAIILLLVGFGSLLLYLQLKHSTIKNNTAVVIEKSDTVPSGLHTTDPLAEKKLVSEKKEQSGLSSAKETNSGKVITIINDRKTTTPGYADQTMVGLIERSSLAYREENGIAPTQGMPRAATPDAPQGIVNKKLPVIDVENEFEIMSTAAGTQDTEATPVSMDEKASRGSNMKTITDNNEITEAEIFTVVEESPHYPGGGEMMNKFLQENIQYPKAALEASIQGTVYMTFVVEKDGSITDVHVLRGIGGGCDEEATRVIKRMPKWIPGKQRGKPVRVQFLMPINFKLAG